MLPADGSLGGAIGEPVLKSKIILLVTPVRQGIVTSILVDAITTSVCAGSSTRHRPAHSCGQSPTELNEDEEEHINSSHYCNGAPVEQRFKTRTYFCFASSSAASNFAAASLSFFAAFKFAAAVSLAFAASFSSFSCCFVFPPPVTLWGSAMAA